MIGPIHVKSESYWLTSIDCLDPGESSDGVDLACMLPKVKADQFHTFHSWSFQWLAPFSCLTNANPKMYFSNNTCSQIISMGGSSKNVFLSRAVSWTKASICCGSRLRHQLQIDFITHSNPQLGIANATQLMRRRNPKQVYIDIVFCPPVRGAAEMLL